MARRTLRLIAILIIGTLIFPAGIASQPETDAGRFDAIDAFVRDEMDGSNIPGVALAIIEDGKPVHLAGFGTAGDDRDVTPQTPFPIGSLTKSMTALSIMQLVEAGRIDLDAPVQAYLPWFTVADEDAATRITIRHLLNQTSGLSRRTGIELVLEHGDADLEETVRSLATAGLNRPVGESYEYSNANYAVLSLVVQEVSGQPFGDYLEANVFTPLGMESATTSLAVARERGLTDVHRYWFGLPVETALSELPGHEPAFISVEDMATYVTMFLNDGRHGDTHLLSAEGIRQMLTPATNETTKPLLGTEFTFRYGMGWFVGPFGAIDDARWHLGELPSFNAWMVLMPGQDRAVVVLTNADSQLPLPAATGVMSRIPNGIVNLLADEPVPEGMGLQTFYVFFDAVVVTIVALQLAALVRLWRRPLASVHDESGSRERRPLLRFVTPLLWELPLAIGILLGGPMVAGTGWRGTFTSMPDLAVTLLLIASLWLLTATVRVARLVRERRTAHPPAEQASIGRATAPAH